MLNELCNLCCPFATTSSGSRPPKKDSCCGPKPIVVKILDKVEEICEEIEKPCYPNLVGSYYTKTCVALPKDHRLYKQNKTAKSEMYMVVYRQEKNLFWGYNKWRTCTDEDVNESNKESGLNNTTGTKNSKKKTNNKKKSTKYKPKSWEKEYFTGTFTSDSSFWIVATNSDSDSAAGTFQGEVFNTDVLTGEVCKLQLTFLGIGAGITFSADLYRKVEDKKPPKN